MEENKNTLLAKLDRIENVVVTAITISGYIKPYVYNYSYSGDTKFIEALNTCVKMTIRKDDVFVLSYTNKGSDYQTELSAAEFAQYLAIEMLRNTLSVFTKQVNQHAKGFNGLRDKEDRHIVSDEEVNEILRSYENGSHYWKNIICQQTEIENAKKKSVDSDNFGSGNPTV